MAVVVMRNNITPNETDVFFNESEYHFDAGELEGFLAGLVQDNKLHMFGIRKGERIDLAFDMNQPEQMQLRDETAEKVKEFVEKHIKC